MAREFIGSDGTFYIETGTRQHIAASGAFIVAESSSDAVLPAAAIAWTEGSETFAAVVDVAISGVAAAAAWTEGSETFAMVASAAAPAVTLAAAWTEGSETFALVGSVASLVPTITILGVCLNNDYHRASEVFDAFIHHITTGALIVKLTAQTTTAYVDSTNRGGDLALASVSMTSGVEYRVVLVDSTGREGVGRATAV